MKATQLVLYKNYYSKSIKGKVKLISINEIIEGAALVTVLYKNNLYLQTSFNLKEL